MSLMRWDPFREIASMREAVNRLFDEGMGRWSQEFGGGTLLVPMDVYETDDSVIVTAELPGIKPEDVDIRVTGNTLSIQGESKQEEEQERGNVYYRERRYGRFQRTVSLPSNVDMNKIDATFENGVLKVTAAKTEEAKPRQIQVRTGTGAQSRQVEAGGSRR